METQTWISEAVNTLKDNCILVWNKDEGYFSFYPLTFLGEESLAKEGRL
jgi:hypothetical protein